MAFADGNIIIGTSVDVGGIDTGLHKIQKSFKRLGRLAFATIGVGAFAKLGKAAIDAASDLQEVQNVVDVAFKDMSYKIEEFSKICIEHFGISEFAAKQTSGSFMAMAKAIGITKETASDMAVELTGLTGDFASFYNISQEYARVAISSVFTGETETIKRYGIIMTEANLQEYALTEGIQKKVKAMNAEEKALLRYNYLMKSTQMLHGDFERTQENWANSVRVLKEQWNSLMVAMGTVFIQKVQPVVGLLNTILGKLIAIFKYLQELLGLTSEIGDATFADDMEEMADAVDDVGKAIKHQLAPFDKLNNLTSNAGSGVDDSVSDLEKLYDKAKLSGYVIDAMKNFEIQLDELSKATKSKLANVVNLFRRAKFKVESILDSIKFSHWFGAGMTFGDLITSMEEFVSNSIASVNWAEKGKQIGEFFEGIIWSDALGGLVDVITSALDGIITMAISALDKIDIQDVIKLAKNYSKAARKFFNWIYNTLKRVDWTGLGRKLGTFIQNIDWGGVFADAIKMIFEAFKSAIKFYAGVFDGAPIVTTLVTGIVAAFKLAKWTGLSAALNKSFGLAVKKWRKGLIDKDGKLHLDSAAGKAFRAGLGVVSIGMSLALEVNTIKDIAVGDLEAGSWEANVNNLISSLLMAVGGTLVLGAFGVTLGPAGFIITAGVTFIVSSIIDAIVEPTEDEKLDKAKRELEENISKIDWVHEIDDTIDVLLNLSINYRTKIADIEGDLAYYEDLAKKWKELSDNYDNLTERDKELVKMFGDEMGTKFPEMKKYIDDVSGAYKGTAENLQLVIDKTRELMQIEAIEEGKKETYKELAKAHVEKEEAERQLDELERTMEDDIHEFAVQLQKEWSSSTDVIQQSRYIAFSDYVGGKQQVINAIEKSLKSGEYGLKSRTGKTLLEWKDFKKEWSDEEALNNMWDYANSTDAIKKKINKLDNAIESANRTIDGYDRSLGNITADLQKKTLQNAINDIKTVFDTAFKGTNIRWEKDVQDAIDGIDRKLKAGEAITEADMIKLYATINTGFSNLPKGSLPKDVQSTLDSIRQKLAEGKVTYSEAMQLLANAMVTGFNIGLGDPSSKTGLYKVLDDQKDKVLKAISSWKDDISNATKKAVLLGVYENTTQKAEQEYYDTLTPEQKLKYSGAHKTIQQFGFNKLMDTLEESATKGGKDVQNATVDGITTITPENETKLENGGATISNTLIGGVKEPLKINSPSKVMRDDVAGSVVEGLVIGLYNGISAIVSASQAVVSAMVETFDVVKLTPNMTITPEIDLANAQIPDIVNGMVVPAQVSSGVSINNSIVGMNKQELSEVLYNILSNWSLGVSLEPDETQMFKSMQKQARIYKERTNKSAF